MPTVAFIYGWRALKKGGNNVLNEQSEKIKQGWAPYLTFVRKTSDKPLIKGHAFRKTH